MIAAAVLAGFVAALAAPALARRAPAAAGWLLAIVPAGLALWAGVRLPQAAAGAPVRETLDWVPALGLQLSFRADGLSLLMALLISGIGALVIAYAGGYMKGRAGLGRLLAWLLAFMASMLGVVLADNLILLFVFWELTSLTSFILIGFHHEQEGSRAAALQALLVTGGGGLALLAGLILMAQAAGTAQISALAESRQALQASSLYLPALALVLIGAFAKSAQVPFHFWLPNAMVAPTPVSAYLHSATMVKAGVYLLARLGPALGGSEAWTVAVGGVGAATMLVGALLALGQTDLKRLLAYSTVSSLGMMTMLIGLGTPAAIEAAVVLILAHGLYKGALFLVAGALDHETGTRDATRLRGLARAMPWTAAAAGLAALSMAGLPPLLGFVSKELVYGAALTEGAWIAAAAVAAAAAAVFVALLAGLRPFWGRPDAAPAAHEAPWAMRLGPLVLAGASVLIGAAPDSISALLAVPAAAAALGAPHAFHLALWHGWSPVLALSLATLALGAALYTAQGRLRLAFRRLRWRWGPAEAYERALGGLARVAAGQTRLLQSGYLRSYLIVIVLASLGLSLWPLLTRGGFNLPQVVADLRFYEVGLAVLILAAALMAVSTRSRLGAVAALGAAGYGVALLYLLFGAPDLAMTQFLIESLTVILFVLAFYHLPRFAHLSSRRQRARDLAIAGLVGVSMTLLVLSAVAIQLYPSISAFFAETALTLAHGRNIVNVILVDFRGLDTLGEITVLSIAGVGVYALLKLPRERAA